MRTQTELAVLADETLPADPSMWARHIAQAITDALYGKRPVQQLLRWTDPDAYHAIVTTLEAHAPSAGEPRPAVRSLRVSTPTANVAEVSALVQIGHRYRAAAMRLEGDDRRWRCTAFTLI
jgi:hypothetical protein